MTKYKKKFRLVMEKASLQGDVRFVKGKERFQLKFGNLRRQDIKLEQEPAKWRKINISRNLVLLVTKATRQSEYTEIGDIVFMLKFKDGRRIRFYKNDISNRDFFSLKRAMVSSK